MDVDPLASMRCWAIEITLGGRTYDVPALPAVDWWPVLSSGNLALILDFVASTPDDPFNLDDLLLAGEVDGSDLGEALKDAIEETAGRTLHVAYVLATVANDQWPAIGGALAQKGFRWDIQPLGAALDAVYGIITAGLEEKALTKFLAILENESLTGGKKGRTSEKVLTEFEEVAGPRPTAGVKSTGEQSGNARPKTRRRPRPPRPVGPSPEPTPQPGPPGQSAPAASP